MPLSELGWLTILPPILAIIIAIWKRHVILALVVAIFSAELLLTAGNPFSAFVQMVDRTVGIFSSGYSTKVLLFSLLIGALIHLIQQSGGVGALVHWLTSKKYVHNQRRAGLLPAILGSSIFIDTNMSVLTAGVSSQSLFDRFKMSRARLAYIIDSTCAPISVLILINGWGAAILGYVSDTPVENANAVVFGSIPFNFYALITLAIVFYTVISTKVYGPMKTAELKAVETSIPAESISATKKRFMMIPLVTMIASILIFMYITGNGNITQGSGSSSVLWAIIIAILVAVVLLRFNGNKTTEQLTEECFTGMGKLLPLVTLVLLAFVLSSAMKALGTGEFVASAISDNLPVWSIPALTFVLAGFIAFTTGTSWGTFGILIGIVMPIALQLGIDPSLLLGAVLGGAVFGDHASPISDTTVISSLAAGCDLLEHVKTQLPYALFAGSITIVFYLIAGVIG
ncbi:Na+/H+ antiporter NhaC family protein [Kangiella sp. HZ709]|uniref:Na+/H+ antiporter NhaC family protein n=1 Tax=Kangiella sp. HZ709 TaxID=2666328 RepID=UPI0012B0E973|nr:Na+/H+ antiporter NhaC family protein [Kangiella sp. HZ709]MRX28021.1 sodium:proton antiporter [Kangiella sp. HZ709]